MKYLHYVPNTRHSLNDEAVAGSLAFLSALAQGLPLPEFSWDVSADGTSIAVNVTSGTLQSVLKWEATSLLNRDFRQATFGDLQGGEWVSSPLTDQGGGQFHANVAPPPTGATALMVELTYDVGGYPLVFTTEVTVAQVPEPTSCAFLLPGIAIGLFDVFRLR